MSVISIERARNFGILSTPYSGFLMTTPSCDNLILLALPIAPGGDLVEVMAHEISRGTDDLAESTIVLSDRDTDRLIRVFPGAHLALCRVRRLSTMAQFLARNQDLVGSMVLQGAARYGNLTLARAVRQALMGASPAEALAQALQIDQDLLNMHKRQGESIERILS